MEKNKTAAAGKRINGNNLLLLITCVLFVVMYAAGCVIYADKGFTHFQTFLNLFITNAGLICVTCGMTCVMLTGGIDISVGSLIAMDCMILADGMTNKHMNAIALVVFVMVIGVVFGLVQGFLVSYMEIQPFIVTMAGMFFARGMTAVINTDQVSITMDASPLFYGWANAKITLPAFLGYANRKGRMIAPFIRPTVIIALLVVVAIWFVLKYTKFGRVLYAVGGNEQSAKMMGLNVRKVKLEAYVLSSVLCSIGGILFCLNTMTGAVTQAKGLEMSAIAAAVIGGTLLTGGVGNVWGSLVGVLITGTITTLVMTNGKLLSSWANIMTAALLCVFILLQSVFAYIKNRGK
ncbi:MAG: sugar ABC transporter permease YjfF [Clostridiales bacterium]|uniref:ABC transporter permease subunit n=1 Tax=Chordicoccus furentiruminis TaxID=2709410 RepID=UPI0023A89654|nr:sugar ABC transporter permease YjfF [Chordicoccus furentiruminis]MCI6172897.1 sugar ABC transporter permease YjfF [Clostridiales bacterium]